MGDVVTASRRQVLADLRRAASEALDAYDLAPVASMRLLFDEFNTIYDVRLDDGARYILRLSARQGCHGIDETIAELAWLHALRSDTSLHVPRPIRRRNGDFVGVLNPERAPSHHQYVLFERLNGRAPGDRLGRQTARRMGELAATLHEHAASFTLSEGRARRFDRVFPYADPMFAPVEPVRVFDAATRHWFDDPLFALYVSARDGAHAAIKTLFHQDTPPRLIHNDLHPWNVLLAGDTMAAIDFEDLMWGYPVQDIATTFYYFLCRDGGRELMNAYRAGYERVRGWPSVDRATLGCLVANRALILANTVLTSPDPAVQEQAGHYLPLIGTRIQVCLHDGIEAAPA